MATQQTRSLARFMMAPSVVLLFVWMIVPLVITIWFSFQQYNPLNPIRDGFVGFSNYALFYSNPAFLQSILNTLILVVSVLLITVIGGIGSIRGAFIAALLVGFIDTLGRSYFPELMRSMLSKDAAATAAPALSSMLIYILMAVVLVIRPEGLFPASRR